MSVKIYKDGAFQDIETMRRNADGAWTDCEAAYKHTDGAWQEVWSNMGKLTLVSASNLSGNSLTAEGNNLTLYARPRVSGEQTSYEMGDSSLPLYDYSVYASIRGEWTNPVVNALLTMTSEKTSATLYQHRYAYMNVRYYKNSALKKRTILLDGRTTTNAKTEYLEKEVSVTYENEADEIHFALQFDGDKSSTKSFVTAMFKNIMVDGKKYGANTRIVVA